MKSILPLLLVTAVLAGGIGFFAGKSTSNGSTPESASSKEENPDSSIAQHRRNRSGPNNKTRAQHRDRSTNPAVTIRNLARRLEGSSMMGMDFEKSFEIYEVVRMMSMEDIQKGLTELAALGSSSQGHSMLQMMLLSRWANEDGEAASAWAMEHTKGMQRMTSIMSTMSTWMREDPEKAYAWFQENRETLKTHHSAQVIESLYFTSLAQQDMGAAFTHLKTVNTQMRSQLLTMLAFQMGMDVEKRKEFISEVNKLGHKELKRTSLQSVITIMGMQSPDAAVAFYNDIEDPSQKKQLTKNLVSGWMQNDPEAALTWRLSHLNEGEKAESAISSELGMWIARDTKNAVRWMESQSMDLESDNVRITAASALQSSQQYEAAIDWAMKIENDETRTQQAQLLYQTWKNENSEAAATWLDTLDTESRAAIEAGAMPPLAPSTNAIPGS